MSKRESLPNGWAWVSIGDVTVPRVEQRPPSAGTVFTYIDIGSVDRDSKTVESAQSLAAAEAPSRARQALQAGDVLVSMTRPNLNAVALISTQHHGSIGSTGFHVLRSLGVHPNWLYLAVQTRQFIREMCEFVQGVLYPAIRPADIRAFVIPVPPVQEQVRLTAKLLDLFRSLDAADAALARAKSNLDRYRESVLQSAVTGSLTAEWRKANLAKEDGKALLERILRERRERWEKEQLASFAAKDKQPPKGWREKYEEPPAPDTTQLPELPEGWAWASLDAVADVTGGITKDTKRGNQPGNREIPYLRVANVQRGFLDLTEVKTISASPRDILELALQPGDVLFNEGGDRDKLGRGWVWSGELPECIHQNHVFRARLYGKKIHPILVSIHGNTFGKSWFSMTGKQTTNLASINISVLKAFPVPIPPESEASQISQVVRSTLSDIAPCDDAIRDGLEQSKTLRQSILKAAFEGRLVPQDPNDEPASALLKRITAKSSAATATKTKITTRRKAAAK